MCVCVLLYTVLNVCVTCLLSDMEESQAKWVFWGPLGGGSMCVNKGCLCV